MPEDIRDTQGAQMLGIGLPLYSRVRLGAFEVTTLLAGTDILKEPQKIFGINVTASEFAAASEANFIPNDRFRRYFLPTLVNAGGELVLFDTGLPGDPPGVVTALKAAGYAPEQVDTVVLTHMHPDHIGGLMTGGAPTFPNARYVAGSVEYDHWSGLEAGNRGGDLVRQLVTPLAAKMSFVQEGSAVAPGITATELFGHTPGHMGFVLESEGKRLVLAGDFANHYVWSLAYPDWQVSWDMDKDAATRLRRRVLDMAADERIPLIGFHMPFPAIGYAERRGDGYRWVPAGYQLTI
jgi:glyoxylase-like metal-dependent hydrolase (beta-lactamase superfamily II)